ncbi:MAG: sensor histidine kinase [Hyphomonadaceae bacterium]
MALWLWLAGVVGTAILAWLSGADAPVLSAAAALAIAPVLTGFTILPRLNEQWIAAGFVAVWIVAAVGLVAGTGGVASPLAVAFAIAPAMALALRRPWAAEAGAGAVLGYALAAGLAQFDAGVAARAGGFPEMLSVVSLAFAAGLMAIGHAPSSPTRERAMGERIAEVSHELRTPLTHILGFSEMIERQLFGEISARYVEYAGMIRRSGAHLLGLVNDLLDLSKIEAGRYEMDVGEFDARAVVEEVVRLSMDSADKKQIALGMVTPPTPLHVRADDRAVRRMLINTLSNAIKFTPEGGRVMVTAAASGEALVLETIDNGPGIPEAERESLGQAYERGSGGARAEGTGLGLSLVRALAALHGGALSFHEAPGGGALVRVTLPVLIKDE